MAAQNSCQKSILSRRLYSHFDIAYHQPVEPGHLIVVLRCSGQSCVRSGERLASATSRAAAKRMQACRAPQFLRSLQSSEKRLR